MNHPPLHRSSYRHTDISQCAAIGQEQPLQLLFRKEFGAMHFPPVSDKQSLHYNYLLCKAGKNRSYLLHMCLYGLNGSRLPLHAPSLFVVDRTDNQLFSLLPEKIQYPTHSAKHTLRQRFFPVRADIQHYKRKRFLLTETPIQLLHIRLLFQ